MRNFKNRISYFPIAVLAYSLLTGTANAQSFTKLENGTFQNNLSGLSGSEKHFSFEVPKGASNLSFFSTGGSGDADLYVKFGSQPTQYDFDCRPYTNGNQELCNIPNIQVGTYYVMLRGWSQFENTHLVASVTNELTPSAKVLTRSNDEIINSAGYPIGVHLGTASASATANRYCEDKALGKSVSFTLSDPMGSTYGLLTKTGNWSATGSPDVRLFDEIACDNHIWRKWDWQSSPPIQNNMVVAFFDGNGFVDSNAKRSNVSAIDNITEDHQWRLSSVARKEGNIFGSNVFQGYSFNITNVSTGKSVYTGDSVDGGGGTLISKFYDEMDDSQKSRSKLFFDFKSFSDSNSNYPDASYEPWGRNINGEWVGWLASANPNKIWLASVAGYASWGKYCSGYSYFISCQYSAPNYSWEVWYKE